MSFTSFGELGADKFEPCAQKLYEAKVKAHNMLREAGMSFRMARFIAEDLNEWSPYDNNYNLNKYYTTSNVADDASFFEKTGDDEVADMSKTQPQTGIVRRGIDYLERKYNSTWNFTLEKEFLCSYYLYTGMDREVTLGGQSTVMDVSVAWSIKKVKASVKQSTLSGVTLKPELCKPGLIERHDIQKAAGFSKSSVEKVSDENFRVLRELIAHGGNGQSKLTRLIKGVLLCLDISSIRDGVNIRAMPKDFMTYDIDSVCKEYNQVKGAYFYCDKSYEHHFEIFGHLMMKAYPCKEVRTTCLVEIPADGERCIVLTQAPVQTTINSTLTGANTWGSLLRYADDIGCSHLLERAIVIAGCLRENRFLSRVMLPCVASKDELIRPCLAAKPRTSFNRGWLTPVVARVLGRMAQCQMHMLVKDVLVANRGRADTEADWNATVENFFRYQKMLNAVKEEVNFEVPLVRFCSEMEWISLLVRDDYDEVLKVSALETFWAMDKCKCVAKGGIVKLLKQGVCDGLTGLDANGKTTDYQVFIDEAKLAGIRNVDVPMQHGKFSVYHSGFGLKLPKWKGPSFKMVGKTNNIQNIGFGSKRKEQLVGNPNQKKSKRSTDGDENAGQDMRDEINFHNTMSRCPDYVKEEKDTLEYGERCRDARCGSGR